MGEPMYTLYLTGLMMEMLVVELVLRPLTT